MSSCSKNQKKKTPRDARAYYITAIACFPMFLSSQIIANIDLRTLLDSS